MPPLEIPAAALELVGDLLRSAGYVEHDNQGSVDCAPSGQALSMLQTLFEKSIQVATAEAASTLGQDAPALLERSSFVAQRGGYLVPQVRIVTWHDLLIAGDLKGADHARDDAVFAVSGTTKTLDNLRLDHPVRHAVDLGCGSGALALRLSAQAVQVSATDINPRAVAFTRANAALNRIDNVGARLGSLFDPLQGETVDLILGNLPFVLSPDQQHLYRDGDRPSSQMITEAALGAVDHLSPGGVAQFTCNWPVRGADAAAWPRVLASQSGIDMLAIEYRRRTPLDHARNWNRPSEANGADVQQALERRWTDWFAAQNVDHICFGALILRRSSATRSGRFAYFTAHDLPGSGGGRQVERMLRSFDHLLTPDSVPVPVPHVVYQQLVHDGAGYTSMPAEFFAAASAGVVLTVAPDALPTMLAVDGSTSIVEIAGPDEAGLAVLHDAYRRGLIDLGIDPRL